ncbi:MAG: peptidase S41 [Chitinophagaceae bacterium]|nr:peptidase S41 [Polaromonas sp.]
MQKTRHLALIFSGLALTALISACGGGGGNPGSCSGSAVYCGQNASGSTSPTTGNNTGTGSTSSGTYTETGITAANAVAGQCAAPRAAGAVNPFTGQLYGDKSGSLTTEKQWIRAFVNDTYLWYKDIVPQDPGLFVIGATVPYVNASDNSKTTVTLKTNLDVVETYFNSQRSVLFTSSGKPKDRFHFIYPTADWVALSTAGNSVGFGFQVALLARTPPRKAVVAYSEPLSPAGTNKLTRGAQFLSVNGVDVASGDPAVLNEGLFSPLPGKKYTFQVLDLGSTTTRTFEMTATTVTSTPVQNVRTLAAPYTNVGYLQFNDHIATSESQLIAAVNQLKAANNGAGVADLVLDLRYNGGGLLSIASELAYMIAGDAATNGKVFEKLSFNDKNPFGATDASAITPFYKLTQGFSTTRGVALPQLNLPRVFVLTGGGTCSASEAIMNGLTGVGVEVIQVGNTTCGKPYGFIPQDNCSVTYFTVQFKGVNQAGFGDYADGFVPSVKANQANLLAGCVVADDFTKQLGDSTEARLAAALQYRTNKTCGAAANAASGLTTADGSSGERDVALGRSFMRENRIYSPQTGL